MVISSNESGRNWTALPNDVTALILSRLGTVEILEIAQMVCKTWSRICKQKNPNMWRTIHMCDVFRWDSPMLWSNYYMYRHQHVFNPGWEKRKRHMSEILSREKKNSFGGMCYRAINLGCGNLVDISIHNFGTDQLLKYMADSSRGLIKRLSIVASKITGNGLIEVASKLPLLEDLEISHCAYSSDCIQEIGRSFPLLKSFKLNMNYTTNSLIRVYKEVKDRNADALAISQTMHGLHHLQLFGNRIDYYGLQAILDGCPRLQSLDLRCCYDLFNGNRIMSQSMKRIKTLRLTNDSTDDYELLDTEYHYEEDCEESTNLDGIYGSSLDFTN